MSVTPPIRKRILQFIMEHAPDDVDVGDLAAVTVLVKTIDTIDEIFACCAVFYEHLTSTSQSWEDNFASFFNDIKKEMNQENDVSTQDIGLESALLRLKENGGCLIIRHVGGSGFIVTHQLN